MCDTLSQNGPVRATYPAGNRKFRDRIRDAFHGSYLATSSVDMLWQLTTMPLSLSLSAIALGFIARFIRPS